MLSVRNRDANEALPGELWPLEQSLNFLHSGHWNDLRVAEGIASEPHSHLVRKLQFPLDRLEARLLAQWIEERLGLHAYQPWITQSQSGLKPIKRPSCLTPLCINHTVPERERI